MLPVNTLLPFLVFWPMVGAVISYIVGRRDKFGRDAWVILVTLLEAGAALWGAWMAFFGSWATWTLEGFCVMGLKLRLDGFRALYAAVAALMWLTTSLFSREYFARHYHNRNRYYFFLLITLGATMGVMLSASFFTTFIFFEIMSLASYPWVAHDEKSGALRAAETYLGVAISSGMVTLMGLFLLWKQTGTLDMDNLSVAVSLLKNPRQIYLPCALTAVGFAAKAGMFPLHIWLPKAHPVAPAPASALLSGVLTKTGVFGVLALTINALPQDVPWGNALLILGVITMFLGALMALFSVDLKRTLACSSMSQIGFITVGIAMLTLLGEDNGLAAHGTVLHMVNHSLFKLILFLSAGTVYMRLHKLNLNDIRGFGRKKPFLHFAFLMGALGIMGMPGFSGYISKSLLHESILEYAHHLAGHGHNALAYQIAEKVFVVTGGLTAAYMTKLYIAIFWEKHPSLQAQHDEKKDLRGLSLLAVCLPALLPPLLGALPNRLMDPIARMSQSFLGSRGPAHTVNYFSLENLLGAAESLAVGALVYLLVARPLLTKKEDGVRTYVNRWPDWLDLEDGMYRPLMGLLVRLGGWIGGLMNGLMDALIPATMSVGGFCAGCMDRLTDALVPATLAAGTFLSRVADDMVDGAVLLLRRMITHVREHRPVPVGTRFTYAAGRLAGGVAALLNRTFRRNRPIETDFVTLFAAGHDELNDTMRRVTRSVSFGLLLLCIGLYLTLIYLQAH